MSAIDFAGRHGEELTEREAEVTGLIACTHRDVTERLIPGAPVARTIYSCAHCGARKIAPGQPEWSRATAEAARALGFRIDR